MYKIFKFMGGACITDCLALQNEKRCKPMTTYEILSLFISQSGEWIALMSVSLSAIFFLSRKK